MPDRSDISLDSADGIHERLNGPDEDDAEAMYDPDDIEISRGRELGLGVGARDLEAQRDPRSAGTAAGDDGVERIGSDDISAADVLGDNDANMLDIDEEFDTEDTGPDAERRDDRNTSHPR
jgi:hypothetical protein